LAGEVDNKKGTPVTQAPSLVSYQRQSVPAVTQASYLVAYRHPASTGVRTTQAPLLVAYRQPASTGVRSTQDALLATVTSEGNIDVNVTQFALLVLYKTGVGGQLRQRAWTFDFDGHTFYALDLAEEGTWVYDTITDQWSKFETPGYGVWNMLNGISWESNRMVVGGDSIVSTVYRLDPESHYDDGWRPVPYKVTGGVSSRSRDGARLSSLRMAVSAGYTVDANPTMTMSFSDDNGATWSKPYDFNVEMGNYTQRVEWNSLGLIKIPGRVFEFSDQGGLIRIDGVEAQIEGQE